MGALLWLNAERFRRAPTTLFDELVRCSAHGCSFTRLQYYIEKSPFNSLVWSSLMLSQIKPYSTLSVMLHCVVHRKDSCRFYINRKGGTGGDGLTHRTLCTWRLLGLAVKWPWLAVGGTIIALAAQGNATLRTVGGSFLTIKVVWALNSGVLAENADYCKFNRVTSPLIMAEKVLGFSFGIRALPEMKIQLH